MDNFHSHALAHSVRIDRVARSRIQEVDFTSVAFSSIFSDHMFISQFRNGTWGDGLIRPFGEVSVSPSISGLQYGISVFDGMKAYRSPTGNPLLFRPAENARRFQRSA